MSYSYIPSNWVIFRSCPLWPKFAEFIQNHQNPESMNVWAWRSSKQSFIDAILFLLFTVTMLLSVFPLHQSFLENDHVLRQLIPNTLKAYMFAGGPSCGRPVLRQAPRDAPREPQTRPFVEKDVSEYLEGMIDCGRRVWRAPRLVTVSKGRPQKTPDPTGTIHPRTHRDLRNPSRFVDAG